jgi:hypothetical protein
VLWGRAILSYVTLIVFLILPTMGMRRRFALGVARLPVWKEFEFFTSMYRVIAEQRKHGENDMLPEHGQGGQQ